MLLVTCANSQNTDRQFREEIVTPATTNPILPGYLVTGHYPAKDHTGTDFWFLELTSPTQPQETGETSRRVTELLRDIATQHFVNEEVYTYRISLGGRDFIRKTAIFVQRDS